MMRFYKNKIGKFVFYNRMVNIANFSSIKNNVDGYIAIKDVHEIYLLNPIEFLYDNPSELEPEYSIGGSWDERFNVLSIERDIIRNNIVD